MNVNRSLLRITNRYTLIQSSQKYHGFKTLPVTLNSFRVFRRGLTKRKALNYDRLLYHRNPLAFFSSVINEESVNPKNSDSTITVPRFEFADITFEQPVTHEELCTALQICDSVEEQMLALTTSLSLSPDDIENRMYFCKVIESLLKPFFGNIKIQIFGSTLNGFGFKGCDLDMSFETFVDENEKISYLEVPDVPMVSEVLSGKVTPREICLLPPKEQLLFIHSVMSEYYKESEDPTIFINCHVPLVRFYHDRYGLKCDLSCQNKVAFANTKLMFLFGKLDNRVIPLMMTIRYWAKHVELIGKGLMFNTYTISLLVIHFLQTRGEPILPSAEHLLSLSDSLGIKDMSDTSFLQLQKSVPPSRNKQSLSELLRDFFFYYLYFDFTRVICPLIGVSVPREEFFQSCSRKFRMNSICVQDPMDLTHNVAELVDYKICKKLFAELMVACRFFQDPSLLSPAPSKWGLLCLLDKTGDIYSWYSSMSFRVPCVTKRFSEDIGAGGGDKNHLTAETLLYLMSHVLLLDCRPLKKAEVIEMLRRHDAEIDRKKKAIEAQNQFWSELREEYRRDNRKLSTKLVDSQALNKALMSEEFRKFNSENELIFSFECRAVKNTWLGRQHVSLDSDASENLVEKERSVSILTSKQNELIAKNSLKDSMKKMDPFVFICECYFSPEYPQSLLLNFQPYQKSYFNPILGIFLKEYLPRLIKDLNDAC